MIWALNNHEKIEPYPGATANCPCCGNTVIAKCGSILTWHWAHKVAECDSWYEPESEWHIQWKKRFLPQYQEVVIGNHRADIKTKKLVVELQASCISPQEILEREVYYRNMVWLLRGHDFRDNFSVRHQKGFVSFRWKWPRKSWWAATMPIVIDMPDIMIHVKKLHGKVPCGGWGDLITEEQFIARCGG